MYIRVFVCACRYLRRSWIPLKLKLQVVASHLLWVLNGT